MKLVYWQLAVPVGMLMLVACATTGSAPKRSASVTTESHYEVSVVRTSNGVPHVTAKDWGSLGYGYGHAIAQDNLCVLAETFITLRGERSRYFTAQGRVPYLTGLEVGSNQDSDFFFRLVADSSELTRFREKQDATFMRLLKGYADGYSRYVTEIKAGQYPGRHVDCRNAEWLGAIDSDDLLRRLYSANLALSETRMIRKNSEVRGRRVRSSENQIAANSAAVSGHLSDNDGAFASEEFDSEYGLAFGNPHWLWAGVDGFYQVHLRIPGERDVYGASIMGIPTVLIGFDRETGWNHAVSTAERFAFPGMSLNKHDPAAYLDDAQDRRRRPARGEEAIDRSGAGSQHGNAYLQRVRFAGEGPQAWTRMVAGQSTDPASTYFRSGTRQLVEGVWYRAAYTQAEIEADTVESAQLVDMIQ